MGDGPEQVEQVEQATQGEAGYLGVKVISSKLDDSLDANAETARWEESSTIEFTHARIGTASEVHFAELGAHIEQGQHTLVVGGTRARRAALSAVLLGNTELLLSGVVRAPRAHRGVASVSMGRPYVRSGSSLWDLLVFPHDKAQSQRRGVEERHLSELLRFLGFESLLHRVADDWARVVDWAKVLDRRERAALALCRLLYHAPPFALVDDDALSALLPAQVRQVFGAANLHHVTIIVMADADPFDASPPTSSSSSATLLADSVASVDPASPSGYVASIGEFSRALRLRGSGGWEFCSFGYASRAAFDVHAQRRWVWARDAHVGREMRSRLQRRTSTLSQCSTTERRWLVTPEFPLSPSADRSASPMSRRQSSRVVSPALTARSSVSDFAGSATVLDFGSIRSRLLTIDSAIAGLTRQPSPPLSREPLAKSIYEPVAESVSEPITESISDPVAEPISKPVVEPIPEPILNAVLEQASGSLQSETNAAVSDSAKFKMAEPAVEPKSCSSAETLADRNTNRFARPRNYRRSTRPGMGMSPQSLTSLTFIPPASPEPARSRRSESPPAEDGIKFTGIETLAAATIAAEASVLAAGSDETLAGSQPRRFQQSRPPTAASPSRIPRPPHSRCSSQSVSSSSSSVASVPSALPRPKTVGNSLDNGPRIKSAVANPIDELTAALRNL
ncbi:ATP-binding cassette long-chain fatty acid transporter pxa2 [Coemansia sp. RSA 2131]|nr:ATP-binding cassette long-chain fatty acid transporter pxa2 [Coemansia sp. RSA 2131]